MAADDLQLQAGARLLHPPRPRHVVTDLDGRQVHVVITLRPLSRISPSQWQQYLRNGCQTQHLKWLQGILSDPPNTSDPGFWPRQRHGACARNVRFEAQYPGIQTWPEIFFIMLGI
jgi:hypothetical protein